MHTQAGCKRGEITSETTIKQLYIGFHHQTNKKRGFLWLFLAEFDCVYAYFPSWVVGDVCLSLRIHKCLEVYDFYL